METSKGYALVLLAISHIFYSWMISLSYMKVLEGYSRSLKISWTYF
jgi:hypothetical protein